jgi:hypothetical protein
MDELRYFVLIWRLIVVFSGFKFSLKVPSKKFNLKGIKVVNMRLCRDGNQILGSTDFDMRLFCLVMFSELCLAQGIVITTNVQRIVCSCYCES